MNTMQKKLNIFENSFRKLETTAEVFLPSGTRRSNPTYGQTRNTGDMWLPDQENEWIFQMFAHIIDIPVKNLIGVDWNITACIPPHYWSFQACEYAGALHLSPVWQPVMYTSVSVLAVAHVLFRQHEKMQLSTRWAEAVWHINTTVVKGCCHTQIQTGVVFTQAIAVISIGPDCF